MTDEYEPEPGEKKYEIMFEQKYGLGNRKSDTPLPVRVWAISEEDALNMCAHPDRYDEVVSVEVIHDPNPGGVRRCPVCETRGVEPGEYRYDAVRDGEPHRVTQYECHECDHLWHAYEPKDGGVDHDGGDPELEELRERVEELETKQSQILDTLESVDLEAHEARETAHDAIRMARNRGLFGRWF